MNESHIDKLKKIMLQRGLDAKELANQLGITTRTLSDFLRPDGREPSGAVQKLIEILANDAVPAISTRLGLIFIHKDFSKDIQDKALTPDMVVHQLEAAFDKSLIFEKYFITESLSLENDWALQETLKSRGIIPFFLKKFESNDKSVFDVFFSTTVISVVFKNLSRNFSEIIFAADMNRFWPLAAEIKAICDVNPVFVSTGAGRNDVAIEAYLKTIGSAIIPFTGRRKGRIASKKEGYGFIDYESDESKKSESLFFSWNDIKKNREGIPEIEFDHLNIGDDIYFSIGSNRQGMCATDITLISSQSESNFNLPNKKPIVSKSIPLMQIKEAWGSCQDAEGWSNLADVGGRLKFLIKDFNPMDYGHQKLRHLIEATKQFDIRNNDGEPPVYFIKLKR